MPSDLSPNSKANYRSKRNRIQRGIDTGFYTEAELPLARKTVDELNAKLGETNDTIRRPGRPRGEVLRIPKGTIAMTPEETMEALRKSEEELEALQNVAKNRDPKWIPGTSEFIERERKIAERAEEARKAREEETNGKDRV